MTDQTTYEYDVFLSHNEAQKDWTRTMAQRLHDAGLNVWFDEWCLRTGERWIVALRRGVQESRHISLTLSPEFLENEWPNFETDIAILQDPSGDKRKILPLLHTPCDVPPELARLQALNFHETHADPMRYEFRLEQLLADLGANQERPTDFDQWLASQGEPLKPQPPAPEHIALGRLPNTGEYLIGRDEEMARLDAAWDNPQTHLFSLVAWGGVGKSNLINHWLQARADDDYRGARRVYAWSFYSQGASADRAVSADLFINDALGWFGDPDPTAGTPWDKGRRLANLVRQQRTLLILDGLEPLQYPPGPEEGKLTDPSMQILLRELGFESQGLCLISTRLEVADLDRFQGHSAERLDLEHLSPEAGAEYLNLQGVKGKKEERLEASKAFGGHALALTLLGSYLRDACNGDVRRWREIGALVEEVRHGGHARRVMQAYEQWLAQDESELGQISLAILRLLGLYDRPADSASLAALRAAPPIPGLTEALFKSTDGHRYSQIDKKSSESSASSVDPIPDRTWNLAVARLRHARLLTPGDDNRETLDAHPLVREHFAAQLETTAPDAWREGHDRLYQHLKTTTKEYPDTLAEMAPLYAAVAHGCRAGKHQEAYDEVHRGRIRRGNEYFSLDKLGAYGSDLAILANFFVDPWDKPVDTLSEATKGVIWEIVGFNLRALGRLAEARQPMQAGLEARIAQEEWEGAAIPAGNLSELSLTIGEVAEALTYARQSVDFADRSSDDFQRTSKRTTLADVLHQAGHLEEADTTFAEAETMQKEWSRYSYHYSLPGFRYCDLLLSQGQFQEVQERANYGLEVAEKEGFGLLAFALDTLSLGRAYLAEARSASASPSPQPSHPSSEPSPLAQAQHYLNQAVAGLRQANSQDHIPRGLLARAELYVFQEDWARARRDLDEVMEVATRSGMRLFECDAHLGYARLALAEGQGSGGAEGQGGQGAGESFDEAQDGQGDWLKEAEEHVAAAKRLVEETGYHRRDGEVAELEERLKDEG